MWNFIESSVIIVNRIYIFCGLKITKLETKPDFEVMLLIYGYTSSIP
jgi:hypothetical protein